jgi:hypothetical protein
MKNGRVEMRFCSGGVNEEMSPGLALAFLPLGSNVSDYMD